MLQRTLLVLGFLAATSLQAENTNILSDRLNRVERQMTLLEKALFQGGGSSSASTDDNGLSNLEVRLQQLEEAVQKIRGLLEENGHMMAELRFKLGAFAKDVESRIRLLEAPDANGIGLEKNITKTTPQTKPKSETSAPTPLTAAPAATAPVPAPKVQKAVEIKTTPTFPDQTEQRMYEEARISLSRGDYDKATEMLEDFITKYPKSPLAGNAYYWLGESYYTQGDYEKSVAAFGEGYKKYPRNIKAPDILLKLALSFSGLNKRQSACATLKKLRKDFPSMPMNIKTVSDREYTRFKCR